MSIPAMSAKGCQARGVGRGVGREVEAARKAVAKPGRTFGASGGVRLVGGASAPGDAGGELVVLFLLVALGLASALREAPLDELAHRDALDLALAHRRIGAREMRGGGAGGVDLRLDRQRQALHEALVAAHQLDPAFATELGAPALL